MLLLACLVMETGYLSMMEIGMAIVNLFWDFLCGGIDPYLNTEWPRILITYLFRNFYYLLFFLLLFQGFYTRVNNFGYWLLNNTIPIHHSLLFLPIIYCTVLLLHNFDLFLNVKCF